MPRPPFFGDETPKVVGFIKQLSDYHRKKNTQISLTTLAQRVQDEFKHSPCLSKQAVEERARASRARAKAAREKAKAAGRKPPKPSKDRDEKDALRHIIFKLAKKHGIWFGSEF